jgi:hypothetical protein
MLKQILEENFVVKILYIFDHPAEFIPLNAPRNNIPQK